MITKPGHRFTGSRRGMAWALAGMLLMLAGIGPSFGAGEMVQSVVVKLSDDAAQLLDGDRARIEAALGMPVSELDRTRDGAFVLRLGQALSFDAARAAVNRVRESAGVLYASVSPQNAAPDQWAVMASIAQTQPPVSRLMIKYRDPALTQASRQNQNLGAVQLDRLTQLAGQPVAHERAMSGGAYVVRLMQALPADQAYALAKYVEAQPEVEYADPDLRKFPSLVPNDPQYVNQWHYKSPPGEIGGANLPPAWDLTTGSTGIVVAVVDTGIYMHPDLAGRTLPGYDMIADCAVGNDAQPGPCTWFPGGTANSNPDLLSRDADPTDPGDWVSSSENAGFGASGPPYNWFQFCGTSNSSWHGTHVAGTIGAATNNGADVAGINWVSKIVPVRVLGKCGGYTSDIVDGMTWASGLSVPGAPLNPNRARVLNLSLGGSGACAGSEQTAINAMIAAGTTVVIAAGNNNSDSSGFSPGNCNGVITVAATQREGFKAGYSNYGAQVEIAAPGGGQNAVTPFTFNGVLSTLNTGATTPVGPTLAYYQGTSMATPHVVGITSLILSRDPTLSPSMVLSKVQTTSRVFPTGGPACPSSGACTCTTLLCGTGIIDAGAAVAATPRPTTVRHDYNNDRKGDLLWRHHDDFNYLWLMNGAAPTVVGLPIVGSGWVVGGIGDIDNDGNGDIIWYYQPAGITYAWLMNGAGVKSVVPIGVVGPGWTLEAVADLNGDGIVDLVWRHSSGPVYAWYLGTGGTIVSVVGLGAIDPASWRMAGTGDLDGNGTQDIVWSYEVAGPLYGTAYAWMINPVSNVVSVSPIGMLAGSAIAKVGDFDGDGKADLLWRDAATGAVQVWYMNGTVVSQVQNLNPVVASWQVAATGDFNGDGKIDLIWFLSGTGQAIQWLMNGRVTPPTVNNLGSVGANWFLPGQ